MFHEPETIEEFNAALERLREEAGPRKDGVTDSRPASRSLQNLRRLLHLPPYNDGKLTRMEMSISIDN